MVLKMASDIVKVEITDDYMSNKILRSSPDKAISEMIWNALDADAQRVNITFPQSGLLVDNKKIVITDDGTGISWDKKSSLFGKLGASWKKTKQTTVLGRKLHGSEGHGRFKGYALGRSINWRSAYKNNNNEIFSFSISGLADNPTDFVFDDHYKKGSSTGVTVEIDELSKQFEFLDNPSKLIEKIAPVFSLYLNSHPEVKLTVEGTSIDPSVYIASQIEINLDEVEYEGKKYPLSLKIVEWTEEIGNHRELWLCSKDFLPLEEYDKKIRNIGDYSFTAYLSSDLFRELNHQNLLSLSGLSNEVNKYVEEAIKTLKEHFKNRKREDHRTLFETWRREGVYPYSSDEILKIREGSEPVKKAEQELFEILAITVRENLPDFDNDSPKTRKFQLHMLRQAVESGDSVLKKIFNEVLALPETQQKELAELLSESSLSNMIRVSKEVSDRIKFVEALEEIIQDKGLSKHIKERSQLHRILADNTWIFGDHYTLTVDDESLTKVLRKHLNKIGMDNVVIDSPVKRVDGRTGIVDLMLTKSNGYHGSPDYISHLVVELKAPDVHIGDKEVRQAESYMTAVMADSRFQAKRCDWEFWIVGEKYSKDASFKLLAEDLPNGIVRQKETANMSFKLKAITWDTLFRHAKHRLDYLKKNLDISASKEDSLKFLKEKYAQYTESIQVEELEEAS